MFGAFGFAQTYFAGVPYLILPTIGVPSGLPGTVTVAASA